MSQSVPFVDYPKSLFDEVARQVMQDSAALFDSALCASRPYTDHREIVEALTNYYDDQHKMPLVRELWVRQRLTDRARELERQWLDRAAARLLNELRTFSPQSTQQLSLADFRVVLHALERVFQLAYFDNPTGDRDVVEAAQAMVVAFFSRQPARTDPES